MADNIPTKAPINNGSKALMYSFDLLNLILNGNPCSQLCWCNFPLVAPGVLDFKMAFVDSHAIKNPIRPRKTTYANLITSSICPIVLRNAKSQTPKEEPIKPPTNKIKPIVKSTFLFLQCANTPETDEATIWLASVETATAAGIPKNIKRGVIRKPPPTPNKPDKKPTIPPNPVIAKTFIETSAIGRYMYIFNNLLIIRYDYTLGDNNCN